MAGAARSARVRAGRPAGYHGSVGVTPSTQSGLGASGLSIFAVMSSLAEEHGAINLSQGFPDFDCAPDLVDAVPTEDVFESMAARLDGSNAEGKPSR